MRVVTAIIHPFPVNPCHLFACIPRAEAIFMDDPLKPEFFRGNNLPDLMSAAAEFPGDGNDQIFLRSADDILVKVKSGSFSPSKGSRNFSFLL